MKKLFIYILSIISLFLLFSTKVLAKSSDFVIDSNTDIAYTTGETFVSVVTKYTRTVANSDYFYPATGEKVFNIPDLPSSTQEEITTERKYKLDSLKVTNSLGGTVKYTIEEQAQGSGIYIKVPNYKQTTSSSPYSIQIAYNTHDFVTKVVNYTTLQAPALPKDVIFEQTDTTTNTQTSFNYGLNIIVDDKIAPLAKVYPSQFTQSTKNGKTTYSFAQENRIGNSPYMEFGTSVTYKFALTYTTPKTDTLVPESLTNVFKSLSTNIFEISLPREFDETDQKVYFTNVSPTPSNIYKDDEGNIIASFEVPANTIGTITLEGYIVTNQDAYQAGSAPVNMDWTSYKEAISKASYLKNYLTPTKYWQSNDTNIKGEAEKLMADKTTVLDIIKADYAYIGEKLTYDDNKANSENERIGAKAALEGGASVCMEYADLMIALLRAQGIPARAALGYANITETQEAQVRHQWVQVWIPDYGWYSVDPTLESNNMRLGQSIDRVLWEVFNGDTLSNIKVFSADNIDVLTTDGYNLNIYGVSDTDIDFTKLKTYVDIVPNKGYESTEDIPSASKYGFGQWLNTFLKTTTIGKAVIITGPVIILVLVVSVIVAVTKNTVRRMKRKKLNNTPIQQ
ncbi:MAG: Transglutaminase domain-containing protein [candidate division WS6 bacterium GW2011_GWC1_36_11]|uniref:Transglutaminase domain-containing protein n=1 Tax=candidate division WS6 bacterium GW2011_GWC1_36_11 TaxID=1619090 RepID=A0A0G0FSZ2_9BACT|nr:MAG: Transglutaminase domain-containing protein [candidate division WS6 bacterium GW2011_GWC1_36_11]